MATLSLCRSAACWLSPVVDRGRRAVSRGTAHRGPCRTPPPHASTAAEPRRPAARCREGHAVMAEGHVGLLGDSILDNAAYTGRDPAVIDHLRALLPDD